MPSAFFWISVGQAAPAPDVDVLDAAAVLADDVEVLVGATPTVSSRLGSRMTITS
jgi:hypothetical protein